MLDTFTPNERAAADWFTVRSGDGDDRSMMGLLLSVFMDITLSQLCLIVNRLGQRKRALSALIVLTCSAVRI